MIDKELCMHCGSHGHKVEERQYSALLNINYVCPSCNAKWTYIVEGNRPHRFQLEYPKDD